MQTRTQIEIIKAKFEMISIVLDDSLSAEELSCPKYLRTLVKATEDTYVNLNDSICESLVMCKECAQKRELLMEYLNLLDDIDNGTPITSDMQEKLVSYPKAIRDIIDRIDTVLTEID